MNKCDQNATPFFNAIIIIYLRSYIIKTNKLWYRDGCFTNYYCHSNKYKKRNKNSMYVL